MNFIVFVSFSIGFTIVGPKLISYWTQNKITVTNSEIFFLSFWILIQSIIYWLSTFLHSINDFKFELYSFGLTPVFASIFLIALGEIFGLVGIFFGMGISLICGSLILMFLRTKNKLLRWNH